MSIATHIIVTTPERKARLIDALNHDANFLIVGDDADIVSSPCSIQLLVVDLAHPYAALPMLWIALHTLHPGAQCMAVLDETTPTAIVQTAWQGGAYRMASWDDTPERLRQVACSASQPTQGYIPNGIALRKLLQVSDLLDWSTRDRQLSTLRVNLPARTVLRGDQCIHLTPYEFSALGCLAYRAGQVVSHAELCQAVWGKVSDPTDDSVKRLIYRLRQKVEFDPAHPHFIYSYHGQGYLLPSYKVHLIG